MKETALGLVASLEITWTVTSRAQLQEHHPRKSKLVFLGGDCKNLVLQLFWGNFRMQVHGQM